MDHVAGSSIQARPDESYSYGGSTGYNRPTVADGIEAPIPGYVSGGPNYRPGDTMANAETLKGAAPMKCYVDSWKSYSTNEIAIYWNSPLVFVLALLA